MFDKFLRTRLIILHSTIHTFLGYLIIYHYFKKYIYKYELQKEKQQIQKQIVVKINSVDSLKTKTL